MSTPPSDRPRLPLLRRLAYAALTTLALLGAAELGARLLLSPPEAQLAAAALEGTVMSPHPTRIWAPPPGELEQFGARTEITAEHLRAVPLTGAPLRALTLGDSSIFGHGLEDADTLHARLRGALARRGVDVDVLCGAIPGYSTEQARVVLEEVGWSLEPDLLIIGTFWSDANVDNFVDRQWLAALRSPQARLRRLARHSRLLEWLRPRRAVEAEGMTDTYQAVSWVQDPLATGARRVPVQEYAQNLDALLVEASARGVGVVLLLPSSVYRLEEGRVEPSAAPYARAMTEVATYRSALLVDTLGALRDRPEPPEQLFLDTLHPTGLTNGLYAERLAWALVEAGWPEAPLTADRAPPPFVSDITDPFNSEGTKGAADPKGPEGGEQPKAPEAPRASLDLDALLGPDARVGEVEAQVLVALAEAGLPADHPPSWRDVYHRLLIGVSEKPCAEVEPPGPRARCEEEAARRAEAWCRGFEDLGAAGVTEPLPPFAEALGLEGPEAWLSGAAHPGEFEPEVRRRLSAVGVDPELPCAWTTTYTAALVSEQPVRSARCEGAPEALRALCFEAADQLFDRYLQGSLRAGALSCEGPPPARFRRLDDPRFLARLEAWRAEGRCGDAAATPGGAPRSPGG
ncbi:MAG: SGNH/GDSL hydrolase family protein [Alphaproteobacteria bacterium]|nr:SGNH/GDSL hydrolase family protein [Alphaproteobacteria bacterium]